MGTTDVSRLEALDLLAREAGAEQLAREARSLAERVRDGLFYVACVGQFKRGKSTLLNALLGEPILPVGVVPVTAVVTVVRHGERPSARVRFAAAEWQDIAVAELRRFVTEEENPENRKGVAAVEVFVPSRLLSTGMCLVDTPGIGSVFAGNTEVTRAFVPHIDAALVVLGADPPISADELALVQEIAKQCEDVLVALNKADRLGAAEAEEASRFTRRILEERAGLKEPRVFHVSAAERLAGKGPERDWPRLVEALERLAQESQGELTRAAEERGLGLLAERLRRHIDEQRAALARPVEESEKRVEGLHACMGEAERALSDLGYLFMAEQERLGQAWEERREAFLKNAVAKAREELAAAIRAAEPRRGPALRDRAIDLSDQIARAWVERWRVEAEPAAEKMYVQAMKRFADLANGFIERLVATDPAMAALAHAVEPETGFTYRSRLYYTSLMAHAPRSLVRWFLDLVRSRERQIRALERDVGEYLETLIRANSIRIVRDFDDRIAESRRRFGSRIRAALRDVASSAESALERAKRCLSEGSHAVERELQRLDGLRARLDGVAPPRA